mgnify:CR=1 FL=1
MVKRIRGIAGNNFLGYRPVWEMGKAAKVKRKQKMTGENRPSV